jgi:peroxiredoxin
MRRPSRRTVLSNLAWLLAFALAYGGVRVWQHRGLVHGVAPAIAATTLQGQSVSLAALRGRPVLVHFWASWCHICRMEQGSIEAIARNHAVLTVAIDADDPPALKRYIEEHGIHVPVVADRGGRLAAEYGVRAVPTDFIVDGRGNIRYVEVGYSTRWGLLARLWLAGHG